MSQGQPPGYYTVVAAQVGGNLVASLYASGGPMWVGGCTIQCTRSGPAFAVIGVPIDKLYGMDNTRSGGLDTTQYVPPRRVDSGQPYSIIWVGIQSPDTASMTVQIVPDPHSGRF